MKKENRRGGAPKTALSLLLAALVLLGAALPLPVSAADNRTEWQGHTYVRVDTPMTWHAAKDYCEANGGYLATVTSSAENEAIKALVAGGAQAQYWLGLTDEAHEDCWEWVTGEPLCWWPDDCAVDNAFGREHYMQMYRHSWGDTSALGHWNDSANDNRIEGEEAFFSTEHAGFIMETGEGPVPREDNTETPLVYVIGRTAIVTAEGEPTITENTEFITDVIRENSDKLTAALLRNDWDPFLNALEASISERYKDYRLNEAGEVTNGSHPRFTWEKEALPTRQRGMFTYRYEYDARLDPCDIADDLNAFIEAVKERTGYRKIHLASRCLGCNIAAAYLAEYGWGSVESNLFFAGAQMGYDFVGEMFAGKFKFDPDAIVRYEEETYVADDGVPADTEIVKALLAYLNLTGALGLGTEAAQRVFDRVKDRIAPQLLLDTYATCPGYWSMVNDENYEAAKRYVFGDRAATVYARLVEKIDAYHYGVMNRVEEMLTAMHGAGVKMGVICKYGFQTPPFIESSNQVGDNRIEVSAQSMGATTVEMGETFSRSYLRQREREGKLKYISPDRMIDGSTALFPENTWYVKNIEHNPFPDAFHPLMLAVCRAETELTVWDDPAYPPYLYYENNTVSPLTAENMDSEPYTTGFFATVRRFLRALLTFIRSRLALRLPA